jgi:hypothetical protein
VNAITRVEDERLHLGIPTPRLMSEMDARIQQFFYTDTQHNFPLVKSPPDIGRTIPRNTGLILVLLWPPKPTQASAIQGRLSLPHPANSPGEKGRKT